MAEKLDEKETVLLEELLLSNIYQMEAIANLLDEKGILKKTDVLKEIKRLKEMKS